MRLLLIALTGTEALLALALLLYWATRRVYPGFALWAAGEVLQVAGYLLLGLRGHVPDPLSIVVANLAFPLAATIRLDGTRLFFGLTRMARGWYAVPALALGGVGYFFFAHDAPGWRNTIVSLATAVPILTAGALVFTRLPHERLLFPASIAASLGMLGLLLVARGLATVVDPDYQLLRETPLQVASFTVLLALHVSVTIAFLMLNAERLERELTAAEAGLRAIVSDLQSALTQVKTLSGLLPICAHCKKVRDDAGYWTQIEVFVRDRSEAVFSHGICPDCARELYPDIVDN